MPERKDYPTAVRLYPPIKAWWRSAASGTRNWLINVAIGAMIGLHEHELEQYRRKTDDEKEEE
jgi:ABC-type phosphate transport system substrate-binding protein